VYVCVRAMGWSILGLCQTVVNREKKNSPTFVSSFTCKYHRQPRFDSIRLGSVSITLPVPIHVHVAFVFSIKSRNRPRRGRDGDPLIGQSKHAIITKLSDQSLSSTIRSIPNSKPNTKVFKVIFMTIVKGREGQGRLVGNRRSTSANLKESPLGFHSTEKKRKNQKHPCVDQNHPAAEYIDTRRHFPDRSVS
jgi:hypothetical protein